MTAGKNAVYVVQLFQQVIQYTKKLAQELTNKKKTKKQRTHHDVNCKKKKKKKI